MESDRLIYSLDIFPVDEQNTEICSPRREQYPIQLVSKLQIAAKRWWGWYFQMTLIFSVSKMTDCRATGK